MKNVIFSLLAMFCINNLYSQSYNVSMIDVKYSNNVAIPSGQPINLGTSGSTTFTFKAKVTTNINLTGASVFGTIIIYAKRVGVTSPDWLGEIATVLTPTYSSPAYYFETSVGNINLTASDFGSSGDVIYIEYIPNNGGSYKSSNWPIVKNGTTTNPITNNTICCSQTIVLGDNAATITGSMPSGGSGSFGYVWQRSNTGSSWTNISGATSINYSPGSSVTATTYFRRTVTSTGATAVPSSSVLITVDECPESDNVTTTVTTSNSPFERQASSFLNCTNIVQSGGTASFHAGDFVTLKNGFHGQANSNIHVYIEGCNSNGRMFNPDLIEENFSDTIIPAKTKLFTLSPNPATSMVNLISTESIKSVTITSIEGKAMFSKDISGQVKEFNFDVSNYTKGYYTISVTTDTGTVETQKLIKN